MISVKSLTKTYVTGKIETPVLKGIDLEIEKGEFVAIMGRSGAGKSTLMYMMSLLDEPTSGEVFLMEKATHDLSYDERTQFRLHHMGYVFQTYALLPDLTALENILIPLLMKGVDWKECKERSAEALARVGLAGKERNLPSQLSGGEQQRVSIARAVVNEPDIIFADEPTANLDNASSDTVMDVFRDLNKKGQTIIMVTHEEVYGKQTDRIIEIDDGRIV